MDLVLVEPCEALEAKAMEYRQEYLDFGEDHINGSSGFIHYEEYGRWLEEIRRRRSLPPDSPEVPASTYFSVRKSDGRIIGTIQLRHYLTPDLQKRGGHIGYGIRPTERNKGYGAQQLGLVLEEARALRIERVMISCTRENAASARVAIKNGGVLTWEGSDEEDGEIRVYWIELRGDRAIVP